METQALNAVSATVKTGTGKVLVEKRDGRVVDFDPINIISAVKSAFADLDKKIGPQEEQLIRDIANQVEAEIKDRYNGPAKIEDIQNLVEHGLIESHLYDVARSYTAYRLNKDIERAKATDNSGVGMKAPEPTLTSITSASSPAASFLERIDAVISGIDSTVAVTSRAA